MESGFECQNLKTCETKGLVTPECIFAEESRQAKVEAAATTYLAPTNIISHPTNEEIYARLEVLENDVDRLQMCVKSLLKIVEEQ